jgi:hypothetical protein
MRDMVRMLQQQLASQQQMQQQQQQQQQQSPSVDIAALMLAMQQQAAKQAAGALLLQSLGSLPTFDGKGTAGMPTALRAREWLKRAEDYFAAREAATGAAGADVDRGRLLSAVNALSEDVRRWYTELPEGLRPATWAQFRECILDRYGSVPDERLRVDQLRQFVAQAAKVRDKLSLAGLQSFMARFQELAGAVSTDYLTLHGKLELLAKGLAQRHAEIVLKEDSKQPPTPLHEVCKIVLSRAAYKEHAAAFSDSGPAASAAAMASSSDPISACAVAFGIPRDEAARYLEPQEGWGVFNTDGGSAGSAPTAAAATPAATSNVEAQMERLLNAFEARLSSKSGSSGAGAGKPPTRRNVPGDVRKDVPEALATARRDAGLCIKCGVAKYEGGAHGHNSRTCTAPVNKTTSAAEGRKKANF